MAVSSSSTFSSPNFHLNKVSFKSAAARIDSKIDVQYQLYLMLSEQFLAEVPAAENRVKMPKLDQDSLNEFLVPLPPLPEQQRIAAKITGLLDLCDQLKARIAAARAKHAQLAEVLLEGAVT